jgi:ribosome-binding factor A
MAKEYSRSDRVSDYLKRELASLLRFELRDPRVGMVGITSIDVSRDLSHARVYFTLVEGHDEETVREVTGVLNKAAGFLRTQLSKSSNMRTVPQLRFYHDSSVARGAYMEELIERAVAADHHEEPPPESD